MKRTRMIILELGKEYLQDENYHHGFITNEWIERVSEELNLKNLSDEELTNMWDMVYLTLENEYMFHRLNEDVDKAIAWSDVESAFTEIINVEARNRRRGER